MHDGVIFIESANTIEALDGATGDLLWQYIRPLPEPMLNGRDSVMRGLAIYQDKIYAPTADGHIVALDVKTRQAHLGPSSDRAPNRSLRALQS